MEASVLSPSATADEMTPDQAREDLLTLFNKSSSYGGKLQWTSWTFCACCGSQYMNENGEVGVAGLPGWVRPSSDGSSQREYLEKRYGQDVETRFGPRAFQEEIGKLNRFNKPGVTVSAMGLKDSINILYSPDKHPIVEGYEINDKEQGHVVSVIWINE